MSRVAFALGAGVDSSRLASYEHARAPLRYGDAIRVCAAYDFDPGVLAGGAYYTGPAKVDWRATAESAAVEERALFSEAYDSILGPLLLAEREKGTAEFEGYLEKLRAEVALLTSPEASKMSKARLEVARKMINGLIDFVVKAGKVNLKFSTGTDEAPAKRHKIKGSRAVKK